MSDVTLELEQVLSTLDAGSAALLERLVRDALALVRQNTREKEGAPTHSAWPPGYFERTAGAFAGEPFEIPGDPPPTPTPDW